MYFVAFNIFRLILPKFLYILYHNSLQLSIRKDNMVKVVLHISLKKIFHCGVYQYACLIRVIFAVFLSRSRSSYRLGNCWIKYIPWLLALDNQTVLWYTVFMRLNKRLYRAVNPVAGFSCHGSSRPRRARTSSSEQERTPDCIVAVRRCCLYPVSYFLL